MKRHLLFVCLPISGHLFPNLAVIRELVDRGHRVSCVTGHRFADLVTDAGAEAILYDSRFDHPAELDLAEHRGGGMGIPQHVIEDSGDLLHAAREALDDDVPDLLLYDMIAFLAGRVLARKWAVPAVQLNPMFASNDNFSLVSMMHPEYADEAPADINEGMARFFGSVAETLVEHQVDLGVDEFMFSLDGLNLVYLPREFQFAGDTFGDEFVFTGPCIGPRPFLGSWQPPTDGRPVVLVSLGGTINTLADVFRTCFEALADEPVQVVATVGAEIDLAALEPLPANVEVHRWLPHLDVLPHAQAFITHGGMGSVMEALTARCPMVVVPIAYDARPTALRIVELGLGRWLTPEELDAPRLRDCVRELAADPAVQDNLAAMAGYVEKSGGTRRAVGAIESYLAGDPVH